MGHGSEPDTTQGPLINSRAADKVTVQEVSVLAFARARLAWAFQLGSFQRRA